MPHSKDWVHEFVCPASNIQQDLLNCGGVRTGRLGLWVLGSHGESRDHRYGNWILAWKDMLMTVPRRAPRARQAVRTDFLGEVVQMCRTSLAKRDTHTCSRRRANAPIFRERESSWS